MQIGPSKMVVPAHARQVLPEDHSPEIQKAAPRALLFDMDGTILDSDPIHIEVFADMLRPFGINVDATF